MTNDKAVSDHYQHGDLLNAIHAALAELGKTADSVTIEDLAPVDEFHIGGRRATAHFLGQLDFSAHDHLLDVGCGLGGAARYVADTYKSRVTGIDLTPEFIETGNALCNQVGLDQQITLQQGSALDLPFQNETFDGGYMLHVGMNIADKGQLFAEISRVLRPGATFGVYDIMRIKEGELVYPVPWAAGPGTSHLATPEQYKQALLAAGFVISCENNRREFALEFFQEMKAKNEAGDGPPPLGLHTLMKESTALKIQNVVSSLVADYIAPVEIVAQKQ